jgi:hypothetical protein
MITQTVSKPKNPTYLDPQIGIAVRPTVRLDVETIWLDVEFDGESESEAQKFCQQDNYWLYSSV